MSMPKLYIVSGCNGSGKTTASYTLLPEMLECAQFVNSDEFAKGLSPYEPEKVPLQASRYMLMKIQYLFRKKKDFGNHLFRRKSFPAFFTHFLYPCERCRIPHEHLASFAEALGHNLEGRLRIVGENPPVTNLYVIVEKIVQADIVAPDDRLHRDVVPAFADLALTRSIALSGESSQKYMTVTK